MTDITAADDEVAHVLSWCTGRGLDHGHTHRDVWGAEGVVWRAE